MENDKLAVYVYCLARANENLMTSMAILEFFYFVIVLPEHITLFLSLASRVEHVAKKKKKKEEQSPDFSHSSLSCMI